MCLAPALNPAAAPGLARGAGAQAAPTPADVAAVRGRAAAAGFPSQTISEEQFKEMEAQSEASREAKAQAAEAVETTIKDLKKIDKLFEGVAAVPWLEQMQDKEAQEKVRMIKVQVMDKLESDGLDVRGAVRRIWQGERNEATLLQGKDGGTQLAIKAILFHTINLEKKHGKKSG